MTSVITKVHLNEAMAAMKPIIRTSLSDEIVERIIDLISQRVLKPGERLPSEKELASQFGVGRTTIREALRSLAVLGIVDGRVGEGTFVSSTNRRYLEKALQWGLLIDRKDVRDLIETRLLLESQTAFWASQRATQLNLQEIEAAVKRMEDSIHDPESYLQADLQFHISIAQASQNSILYQLVSMTRGYLQAWIQRSLSRPTPRKTQQRAEVSIQEHQKILQAIRSGNAEGARQAMNAHILSSSRDLQSRLVRREKSSKGG
jgi:GntR family transcriptional regulator, transcriptional repressor for pyruvate dehydrogenase complex